jgi:hypothetical protein
MLNDGELREAREVFHRHSFVLHRLYLAPDIWLLIYMCIGALMQFVCDIISSFESCKFSLGCHDL